MNGTLTDSNTRVSKVLAPDGQVRPPGLATTTKFALVGMLLWTIVVTVLRAVRWPNEFSKAHWLVDYRFGLVKRGLIGTVVSVSVRLLHTHQTEALVAVLSSTAFVVFCVVLLAVGLRIIQRSAWSSTSIVAVLVFLSSPFVVMSAHLIGYFDNIIIVLAIVSLALLVRRRIRTAAVVQAIAMLVHESSLLVGFPVFCLAWLLINRQPSESRADRLPFWPLLLPVAVFGLLALSQSVAPPNLEQLLTGHLSRFPFLRNMQQVRVPHWIVITLPESYALHRGLFARRFLSASMIGLVLPSTVTLLAFVFDRYRIRDLSIESMMLLAVCLVPQTMHLVAYDTTRIWTYSIINLFLALWAYTEVAVPSSDPSEFVRVFGLVALALNATLLTPLMDGLSDHLDLTTRIILYMPVVATAVAVTSIRRQAPVREEWLRS